MVFYQCFFRSFPLLVSHFCDHLLDCFWRITYTIQLSCDCYVLVGFLTYNFLFAFPSDFLSLYCRRILVFLFWFSLLSMVLVFWSCLELFWLSGDFTVAVLCEKKTSLCLGNFSVRKLITLSLDFSWSYRNSILPCSREIILSVLLLD